MRSEVESRIDRRRVRYDYGKNSNGTQAVNIPYATVAFGVYVVRGRHALDKRIEAILEKSRVDMQGDNVAR